MRGPSFLPGLLAAAYLASGLGAAPGAAQGANVGEGARFGVTFGGISTVGIVMEYFDDNRSLEVIVGTWSFRDLSASVVVKEYFGSGDLLPFLGGGVWLVFAGPSTPEEQFGLAAVLHAPIGVDYRVASNHYVGAALNVNRGLWVRRTDPEDDLPMNRRLVPLPGTYYRWRW